MNTEITATRDEAIEEASKWGVGLGILVVAIAPLAIPIIVLTLVFLAPLALPLIALALVAAPVLLVRRLARSRGERRGRSRSSSRRPRSAPIAH